MIGCVLRALWPVELCTPACGRWVIYIYAMFGSTGLICKACGLGLVHFTGETLSESVQEFCSTNGPDPLGLGASQVVWEQRFCDFRLRLESCISYSRLGGFACKCEVWCALVVTVPHATLCAERSLLWLACHWNKLRVLILASYLVFFINS